MNATTVGVDLAKNVFEIALADERGHIVERQRLSRARFDRFFVNRTACRVLMEACGSAHHHARRLSSQGHEVVLLPAQYVRAYVRRNKTDAADAAALIEAARCPDIRPVPIKSVDQQALQQLHRLRSQWMATRTARLNFLRGCLREFGIGIPAGAQRAIQAVRDALCDPAAAVPVLLHSSLLDLLAEIDSLAQRCQHIDKQLARLTADDPVVERLLQIPGIGPLTATALRASVVNIQRFPSARHFASWVGLTSREHSSGERRRLDASASKAIHTFAPCSSTELAPCCSRPAALSAAAPRSIGFEPGRSTSRNAAATTRPPSPSPTSSPASCGPPGVTNETSEASSNHHPKRHSHRFMLKRNGRRRG